MDFISKNFSVVTPKDKGLKTDDYYFSLLSNLNKELIDS